MNFLTRAKRAAGLLAAFSCACVAWGQDAAPSKPPVPEPAHAEPPEIAGLVTLFPGVRVDREKRLIEIDGEIPIDVNSKETPITYLEVMVCTRDSKEHESLVMTRAKAAHVHAALLLLGLEPGKPGAWGIDAKTRRITDTSPTGPALDVVVATLDAAGVKTETRLSDWAVNQKDGRSLTSTAGDVARGLWVFAGSREKMIEGQNVYKADADGTLIGLCTFGTETIAWRGVLSPESMVQEPEWIADKAKVPPAGTKVVVRVRVVPDDSIKPAPAGEPGPK